MEVISRSDIRKYSKVRLVGNNLNEILPANEAYMRAEETGMDLVLVSDQVEPPVVKIQDHKKIQYEKKKAKKQQRKSSLKEVQFKANISDHDFETKLKSIERFLERGDKVKIVVRLKGRERDNPERATELIQRVAESVNCKLSRLPGPMAIAILEPAK